MLWKTASRRLAEALNVGAFGLCLLGLASFLATFSSRADRLVQKLVDEPASLTAFGLFLLAFVAGVPGVLGVRNRAGSLRYVFTMLVSLGMIAVTLLMAVRELIPLD
ncbi:hypothetical protein N6H14_08840 [Paenibacillus sp. CC-CFT747]|nr:hypothetical protein N6H14_08840 [Paenibacillus sp. CC-CFT747]